MPRRITGYGTLNIQKSTLANIKLLKDVFTGSTGRSISYNDLLLVMMQDTLAQRPEIYANYLQFVTEDDMAVLKLVGTIPKKERKKKVDLGYANVVIDGKHYQLKIHPGTIDGRTGKKKEDYCHMPRPIGKNYGLNRLKKEYNAVIKPAANNRVLGYVSFRDADGDRKRCPLYQGVDDKGKYCVVDGAKVPYSTLKERYALNVEWIDTSLTFESV